MTIFRRFPNIFQNWPECRTNVSEHFPKISGHFPKITEDCRRRPKKIRRCFDHTPTNLSLVKGSQHHSSGSDIFTCEDIISSHVRISYRFYQCVTTRYTTESYIIITVIVIVIIIGIIIIIIIIIIILDRDWFCARLFVT